MKYTHQPRLDESDKLKDLKCKILDGSKSYYGKIVASFNLGNFILLRVDYDINHTGYNPQWVNAEMVRVIPLESQLKLAV